LSCQVDILKKLEEDNKQANQEYEEAVNELGKIKHFHHPRKLCLFIYLF
jgi:hypothetical protein